MTAQHARVEPRRRHLLPALTVVQRDAENRLLGEEEIADLALVAIARRALHRAEEKIEHARILRHQPGAHADLALQAQVTEPPNVGRQARRADVGAPGHGLRGPVRAHHRVLRERLCIPRQRERAVGRERNRLLHRIAQHGQRHTLQIRVALARQDPIA